MNNLKQYLLATGCFVILVGVFTLMSPTVLQGDEGDDDGPNNVNVVNTPLPVVVQNGTMVETLVTDGDGAVEFNAVNVREFRFVSLLGKTETSTSVEFAFSTEPGKFSDNIPKVAIATCELFGPATFPSGVRNCSAFDGNGEPPEAGFRVAGPYLLVRLNGGTLTTLEVFLSR